MIRNLAFALLILCASPVVAAAARRYAGRGETRGPGRRWQGRMGNALGRDSRHSRFAERPLHGPAGRREGGRNRSDREESGLVLRFGDLERQRRQADRGPRVSAAEGSVMIAESGPGRIIEVDRGKLLHEIKLKMNHPIRTWTRGCGSQAGRRTLPGLPRGGRLRPGIRTRWRGRRGNMKFPCSEKSKDGHGPESISVINASQRLRCRTKTCSTGNGHSVLQVTPKKKIRVEGNVKRTSQDHAQLVTTASSCERQLPDRRCHAGPHQAAVAGRDRASHETVVWTGCLRSAGK